MTSATTSRSARTRAALLEATERCLARGGYPGATTTAIAAEAGVAAGTFYVHFDDREDVLAQLFALRLRQLLDDVQDVLAIDALVTDGLEALLDDALDVVLDTYRDHAATFRAALVQLPSSPEIRRVYWQAHGEIRDALVDFLRRGQSRGHIRDRDPEVLAETLLVVVQGANNPQLLTDPAADATRAVVAELSRLLRCLLAPSRHDNGRA